MRARVEYITPGAAAQMLQKNTNNYRKITPWKVAVYARDMMNGTWELNGEAIKFNEMGELVDGQHRLAAIVESDTPVSMLVIRGVPNEVSVFDSGKNRTLKEIALASGIQPKLAEGTFTGAAAIILMGDPKGNDVGKRRDYPTRSEITEHIIENMSLWEEVYELTRQYKSNVHGNSIIRKAVIYAAAFFLLKTGEDENEIADFFDVVGNGFPIDGRDCSSAIVLRNMLLSYRPKERAKYYSAAMCAFEDFKNGVHRVKPYTRMSDKHLENLREMGKVERK